MHHVFNVSFEDYVLSDHSPQALPEEEQQAYKEKARKALVSLCRGNGVKKEHITFAHGDIFLYEIAAENTIQIHSDMVQKTIPGKQDGDICESQADLQARTQNYISRITQSPDMVDTLYTQIIDRTDKGVELASNKNIALTNYDRIYIFHEPCGYCKTKGHILCQQCDGHRMQRCIECDGITRVHCTYCHGSGRVKQNNNDQSCYHCDGRGQMQCTYCRGNGKTTCRGCGGKGQISCNQCSSTGWFSHLTTVTLLASGTFIYDPAQIPDAVKPIFSNNLSALVTKHAIKLSYDDRLAIKEDGKFHLNYVLSFPYGKLEFLLKKMRISFDVFGYKKQLINIPNFLDRLIRSGHETLKKAASGQGNVPSAIKKSSRYRLIGIALINGTRGSRKRNRKILKEKYPYALSKDKIEKIVYYADRALSKLTRKPRYLGIVVGGALTAICFSIFYLTTARVNISQMLSNAKLDAVIDIVAFILAIVTITLVAQLFSKQALQNALGHLLPADQRKNLTPKAGRALYIAVGITCFLILVMLEINLNIASSPVNWYFNLRS